MVRAISTAGSELIMANIKLELKIYFLTYFSTVILTSSTSALNSVFSTALGTGTVLRPTAPRQ